MITLSFPIQLDLEDILFIQELQKSQSAMIRSAYNLARTDTTEKEIRIELNRRFYRKSKLDSWFIQSAVKSGMGSAKADKELGVKSRIFGGRNNFIRRCKNLIDKEQFREIRLLPVYLIGESPKEGNRKFDFYEDKIIFKPWNGKKLELFLPKLKKNWSKKYRQMVALATNRQLPITVSLTPTTINLSFNIIEQSRSNPIENRYAGIDMNPNYIGISVWQSGMLVSTKMFDLKDLTGKHASDNKLEHETIEIGHSICKWLRHLRVDKLFIEDLSFKPGDKKIGKNFNRLVINQWKRSTIVSTLEKYFTLYKINAAYTSTIGNICHRNLPDPVAASAEIARRGFALVVSKNKQFYPPLPSFKYLSDLWKETEVPDISDWKELHSWIIKNMKLRYRVPIPDRDSGLFRSFSSEHSFVRVL